jgi:hypothetical protein
LLFDKSDPELKPMVGNILLMFVCHKLYGVQISKLLRMLLPLVENVDPVISKNAIDFEA